MRRILLCGAVVCIVAGLALVLYYPLTGAVKSEEKNKEIAQFYSESSADTEKSALAELLTDMQEYNDRICADGQTGLKDAWSYEQPWFELRDYGFDSEVFAVLQIPDMGEELPVYLGATEENMSKGVAVLGQTSMPVGGKSTNCVIAGHRGNGSEDIFRNIQVLEPGDEVILDTFWGEKEYKVESTAVIEPDEIDAILIQEGREMLTLITCHPYPENSQRYVVYCTAADNGGSFSSESEKLINAEESEQTDDDGGADSEQADFSSGQKRILLEKWLPFLSVPLVLLFIAVAIVPKKRKERREHK